MKAFAELYTALDATTKTNEKIEALSAVLFSARPPEDAAWAIHFLIGRRPEAADRIAQALARGRSRRPASRTGCSASATTRSATWPRPSRCCFRRRRRRATSRCTTGWRSGCSPLREWDEAAQRDSLVWAWREMDDAQRFVWNKLITGEFRVGVSQNLVVRALAEVSGVDASVIAHRLMGDWEPTADSVRQFLAKDTSDADISRPVSVLPGPSAGRRRGRAGADREWQVEWKWDGIRSQLIRRGGRTFLWSRGEELITDRFPED